MTMPRRRWKEGRQLPGFSSNPVRYQQLSPERQAHAVPGTVFFRLRDATDVRVSPESLHCNVQEDTDWVP